MSHPSNDIYLEAGMDLSLFDEYEAVNFLGLIEDNGLSPEEVAAYCKIKKLLGAKNDQ